MFSTLNKLIFIAGILLHTGISMAGPVAQDDLLGNDLDANTARGLVKAVSTATISSQISAEIKQLSLREGESFNKGDTLVVFNCESYLASYQASLADLDIKTALYENNQQLKKLAANSEIDVDIARAEMEMAKAESELKKIRVRQCKIKAPFSGKVLEKAVNVYENVVEDTELLTIVDDANLEIELIVPSEWYKWLEVGQEFTFTVDETAEMHVGKVTTIGASVDPVSQTLKLTGEFTSPNPNVIPGMSGSAGFSR